MKSRKKRKATKYKTIKIKVTAKQKKSLENFCKARRITPNKIIKKAIRPLLENYVDAIPPQNKERVRQLALFSAE